MTVNIYPRFLRYNMITMATITANFWSELNQPFVGLAPMDGITDLPFRQIVQKYADPDVMFTEFVNVEGLCHNASRLLLPLQYDPAQRPVIAQLSGKRPAAFRQAAILVAQLGFDGIDLNMGCPSKNVAGSGAGAGLIKTPSLAAEIIQAAQQGVQDWADGAVCSACADFAQEFCQLAAQQRQAAGLPPLSAVKQRQPIPVSVKTRLGYDSPALDTWIKFLLSTNITALTVHGRTVQQGYSGQADWKLIGQTARMAQAMAQKQEQQILIIGNGDVQHYQQGVQLARCYQLAGVLIGRAARGNPFALAKDNQPQQLSTPEKVSQLAAIALDHAQLYEKSFQDQEKYSFLPMRKHLAWYIKHTPQAKEIRSKLVRTNSSQEVKQILQKYELL